MLRTRGDTPESPLTSGSRLTPALWVVALSCVWAMSCTPAPKHATEPSGIFCLLDEALKAPIVMALDGAAHVASSENPSGIEMRLLDVLHALSQRSSVLGERDRRWSPASEGPSRTLNCDFVAPALRARTRLEVSALLEDLRRDLPGPSSMAPEKGRVLTSLALEWKRRGGATDDKRASSSPEETARPAGADGPHVSTWTVASRACAGCVQEIGAWIQADPRADYRWARRVNGACHAAETAARALAADVNSYMGLPSLEFSDVFSLSRWDEGDRGAAPGARRELGAVAQAYLVDLFTPFLVAASWLPLRYGAPPSSIEFERFCVPLGAPRLGQDVLPH
jgi:hypothetical protein